MSKKKLRQEQEQLMLDMLELSAKTETRINMLLEETMENISKEITETYYRYKERFGLTDEQMLEVMNKNLKAIDVKDFVKRGILEPWKIDALSLQGNLNRLIVLKDYIGSQYQNVANVSVGFVEDLCREVIDTTRAKTVWNMSKNGVGIELTFQQMSKERMDKLLHHDWLGSNFYKRIQNNCGKFQYQVEKVLTDGVMRGKSIDYMAQKLHEVTHYGEVASKRLVRTEVSHFCAEAEASQLEDWGEEFYEFSATLDGRTCHEAHKDGTPSCGSLDGKIFKLSERKEGVNAPPMHPFCRCVLLPYVDEETRSKVMRFARTKDGEKMRIQYTTFEEWYKQYK